MGNVTSLDEGEYLKAEGEYTEHQVYGRQFKVTSMSVEVPEDEYSIERYLGSGAIRGVGPSLAARIVKKFKKDSFRIIEEEPERLAEIKGISERKAREIYQQFHEKQDMRQAMMVSGEIRDYNNIIPENLQTVRRGDVPDHSGESVPAGR